MLHPRVAMRIGAMRLRAIYTEGYGNPTITGLGIGARGWLTDRLFLDGQIWAIEDSVLYIVGGGGEVVRRATVGVDLHLNVAPAEEGSLVLLGLGVTLCPLSNHRRAPRDRGPVHALHAAARL
jgi:hypothetical protein